MDWSVILGSADHLIAASLSQDRLELTHKVHYSFAIIPMILVTFFGGGVSGLVSFLFAMALTGGFTVDNLFIASIVAPLLLSRVWLKKSHRVFYLTIGVIALYRIVVVWLLVDLSGLWPDVLLYQAASALCLAICYHALNFKERHIYAYFAMRARDDRQRDPHQQPRQRRLSPDAAARRTSPVRADDPRFG